jgi:hypothetical protein
MESREVRSFLLRVFQVTKRRVRSGEMKSKRGSNSWGSCLGIIFLVVFFLSQSVSGELVTYTIEAADSTNPDMIKGSVTITTNIDWDVVRAGDLRQTYTYIHNTSEPIMSGETVIGRIEALKIEVKGNPFVFADFTVSTPGGNPALFIAKSNLLTFDPLMNVTGFASGNITLPTTGKTLVGGYSLKALRTLYNGVSDLGGDTFADLISTPITGSDTVSDDTGGYIPIAGNVSSMQSVFKFQLQGDASASGNAYYDIEGDLVPEPMTIALLGLGGLFIRRRRRA